MDERPTAPQPTPYESGLRALQQLFRRCTYGTRRVSELVDVMQQEGLTDEVRADIGRELRSFGPSLAADYAWTAAAIDPAGEQAPPAPAPGASPP